MARRGGNKHSCDKYKASGHKAENKKKKQDRAKKRLERFAKHKEEGKSYKYQPNPYKKGTPAYIEEQYERANKNIPYGHTNHYSKMVSIMRKLNNDLAKVKLLEKQAAAKEKKK